MLWIVGYGLSGFVVLLFCFISSFYFMFVGFGLLVWFYSCYLACLVCCFADASFLCLACWSWDFILVVLFTCYLLACLLWSSLCWMFDGCLWVCIAACSNRADCGVLKCVFCCGVLFGLFTCLNVRFIMFGLVPVLFVFVCWLCLWVCYWLHLIFCWIRFGIGC